MKTKSTETGIRISSGSRGFTLIEVLAAVALFAVGFLAVGSMQISAVNNNASARMRTEATLLASEKVEELMSLQDYNDSLLDADTHSDASPDNVYCMQWSASLDSPIPSTKTISLSVRWTDGEAGCANFAQKRNQIDIDFIRADL